MKIVDRLDQWRAGFENGWLAHLQSSGEIDWSLYNRPRNRTLVPGPGIDLARSRLLLVSTAGSYLRAGQAAFDDRSDIGDYSIRTYPCTTDFADIAYAHGHYDPAAVEADPEVLIPLGHLGNMVAEGRIGELADNMVSINGYMPDVTRLVEETMPQVLAVARKEGAHAALLVPA